MPYFVQYSKEMPACLLFTMSYFLFLEAEFLHQNSVRALIRALDEFEVTAAIRYEAQKSTAGVLVLSIFIQMCRKFLDPTG